METGKKENIVELSVLEIKLIEDCIERIQSIIEASEFREAVSEQVVNLKKQLFGGEFDTSGFEENYLMRKIAERIGFSFGSLRSWVVVFISDKPSVVSEIESYNDLSFTEKLSVVRDIKQNNKKVTQAIKDHYADKANPVKKKLYYLERYSGHVLATSRSLEELCFKPSKEQLEILETLKTKLGLALDLLNRVGQ